MSIKYNVKFLIKNPKDALTKGFSVYDRSKDYTILKETFLEAPYYPMVAGLKPNTVVLDIGANIGDTAIYFAQFEKVKKVLGFEKEKKFYDKALRHIGSSPLKNKISLSHVTFTKEHLQAILKKYRNIAIKCDIEGYEKNLFDGVELKNVYALIAETHDSKEFMINYLRKQGFKIDYKFRNKGVVFKELGLLYAHR